MKDHNTDISNVLIIGCGGAGLRAAIEVKKHNLNVKVLGKRPKIDSHTVLAAGGINASFGNLDHEDSWHCHFADTYNEGYGIGDPEAIEIMAKEACTAVEEIDKWGANLDKLDNGKLNQRYFGAHSYRRTCFSGDFTGQSILNSLLKKAHSLKIPIFDSEYVSDLLIIDNQCFGAMSINISNGERTIHLADSVILCTGGHTRIWKKSSSRKKENTGDGLHLALKSGCKLIDMEMVQFHPTGMLFPEDIAGTLVTEAVRGEGGKLFNKNGERFMEKYDLKRMELSTRDIVARANYSEIAAGRGTSRGGVLLDISHKSKDFILKKIPKIYRQFIEAQMIDISSQPMEVAPTAHYSMGGIRVKASTHESDVTGLFAAGEVAGGLHGANRLGGNSLAEILIFGKVAGKHASLFSEKLRLQPRSQKSINLAHENIDQIIKKGSQFAISMQEELRTIMWKYCGVIKDSSKLLKGLQKLDQLKDLSKNIEVRISDNNFSDLINTLDFKSSIIAAEATFKSAIMRKESRGAHFRADFPTINTQKSFNLINELKNNELSVETIDTKKLNSELLNIINKTKKVVEISGKLLE